MQTNLHTSTTPTDRPPASTYTPLMQTPHFPINTRPSSFPLTHSLTPSSSSSSSTPTMVNLSIFAATLLLLLLLAVSNATVYQTTIITGDEDGARNQGGQSQRCQQQIQSQKFQQCEQYIRQQAEQQGGQDEVLILRGVRNQQQQEQQTLRQCCEALQNMDQQCQCEGLRQMVQGQQGQGRQERGQREMMQIAQRLPEKCGSGQACQSMQVVWF